MMQLNRLITYGLFLAASILLSGFANAEIEGFTGNTSKVGGSSGNKNNGPVCRQGYRVTAASIKYGDVIDKIRFKCTPISATGRWSGQAEWKSYSANSNPAPGSKTATVSCPTHKFIGSVKGWTKKVFNNRVLNKIQFKCYKMDANGKNVSRGNNVLTLTASSGGSASSWKYCPGKGLANSLTSYSGWHLDALALRCYKGTVLSINVPVTTSPANNGNFSNSALTLKWNAVTAASYYKVSLRDQGNNVFIDPVTGNNTSNQFGNNLNTTSFTLSSAAIARMAGSGRNVSWTVMACPNADDSNECKTAIPKLFRLTGTSNSGVLPKPVLRSPADKTFTYTNKSLKLKWEYVTGAKSYLLVMRSLTTGAYLDPRTGAERPSETPVRITQNEFYLPYHVINKLLPLGKIGWRLKACRNKNNNQGCGQFSVNREFSVRQKRRKSL